MAKQVLGSDGIMRDAVGRAPDWRPEGRALIRTAREARSGAVALEAAVRGGNAALSDRAHAARSEARAARAVADYHPPRLEPSGDMPFGPARGPLDHDTVTDLGFDPALGDDTVVKIQVRKRRGPTALTALPAKLRRTAEEYADLAAAVGSPGCPDPFASRGGGISDGGAAARCGLAQRLGWMERAIGDGVVLVPSGAAAHRDHARTSVTTRLLVDRVCLHGWTIDQLLASHGWSRRQQYRDGCRRALEAALLRLSVAV